MPSFNDSVDDAQVEESLRKEEEAAPLDALDSLERTNPSREEGHLTPAHVFEQMDNTIAEYRSSEDSRLDETKDYSRDAVRHIMKGDAGEGYTYVRLLERYDGSRIVSQPQVTVAGGQECRPDFGVRSENAPAGYEEIVDAKAWSLLRPKDSDDKRVSTEDFMRSLLDHPGPSRLVNMSGLQDVVDRYASSPQLSPDGRVVLYFPEDVCRYSPQIVQEVESWSGGELAHGRTVEVRSMGVWNSDLWAAVGRRR
ncbi:MAG TPA: hypothetical protein VM537_25095 [Anaerolineae bacterium]|nr:hypothetical protein [Anaerolineae bacterium]